MNTAPDRFIEDDRIYPFSTENLHYLLRLGFNSSTAITIAGSGDHAINLSFAGAREIIVFDVSESALHWTAFKWAAVAELNFVEFLEISSALLSQGVSRRVLSQLESLPDHSRSYILSRCSSDRIFGSNFRSNAFVRSPRALNPYLVDPDAFDRAKAAVRASKLTTLLADLGELERVPMLGSSAVMALSNIADYCTHLGGLAGFAATVQRLANRLELQSIAIAYLYDVNRSNRSEVESPERRAACFDFEGFRYLEKRFAGAYQDTIDGVCVLQRDFFH